VILIVLDSVTPTSLDSTTSSWNLSYLEYFGYLFGGRTVGLSKVGKKPRTIGLYCMLHSGANFIESQDYTT